MYRTKGNDMQAYVRGVSDNDVIPPERTDEECRREEAKDELREVLLDALREDGRFDEPDEPGAVDESMFSEAFYDDALDAILAVYSPTYPAWKLEGHRHPYEPPVQP
jgi:hypothetical protein